jgi:cytochrome c2
MGPRTERRAAVVVIGLAYWLWYPAMATADSGDVAHGARVYQRCYSCHTVDPNEKGRLQGPSLYQVIGRRAASLAGFSYSPALMAKGEAGLIWTEEELDQFLLEPERVIPGNQMGFFGLPDARDRADLIAYLKNAAQRPR